MLAEFGQFVRDGGVYINFILITGVSLLLLIPCQLISYLMKNHLKINYLIIGIILITTGFGFCGTIFSTRDVVQGVVLGEEYQKTAMFFSALGISLINTIAALIVSAFGVFFFGINCTVRDNVKDFVPDFSKYMAKRIVDTRIDNLIGSQKSFYVPRFEKMAQDQKVFSWNWASFFFPEYWLAYRKMYLYTGAVILFGFLPYATYGISIAGGFLGNYIYYMHCRKKIFDADSDKSKETKILETAGVNPMAIILIIVLRVGIYILSVKLGSWITV